MLSKVASTFKFALPVTLLASPLLLAAAQQQSLGQLPLTSSPQVAQASGELPDLSGPSPVPAPAVETPIELPTVGTPTVEPPTVETPTIETPAKPPAEPPAKLPAKLPAVETPALQPLPSSAPSSPPPAAEPPPSTVAPAPLANPSPLSQPDPSNFTPTTLNPTPFDGKVIKTLAALTDGNYRYLSGEAEDRVYTDAELQQRGGSVFVFKKEGNLVTGSLLPRIGLPGICVTGIASGNTVSGEAYPNDTTATFQDSDIGQTFQPDGSGALQIRRTTRADNERLYYAEAVLDLSDFSMINAGSSLPPASCNVEHTGGKD